MLETLVHLVIFILFLIRLILLPAIYILGRMGEFELGRSELEMKTLAITTIHHLSACIISPL